jgi:hypothetical protein
MKKTSKIGRSKGAEIESCRRAEVQRIQLPPRTWRRLDSDFAKGFIAGKKKPAGETGWRLAF